MEPHNENSRVKIPALVHFTRIGYQYVSIKDYTGPIDGDTNIFVDLLRSSINRLNGTELCLENTQKIVDELKPMLDNDDLGRAFYNVLLNGYIMIFFQKLFCAA